MITTTAKTALYCLLLAVRWLTLVSLLVMAACAVMAITEAVTGSFAAGVVCALVSTVSLCCWALDVGGWSLEVKR